MTIISLPAKSGIGKIAKPEVCMNAGDATQGKAMSILARASWLGCVFDGIQAGAVEGTLLG